MALRREIPIGCTHSFDCLGILAPGFHCRNRNQMSLWYFCPRGTSRSSSRGAHTSSSIGWGERVESPWDMFKSSPELVSLSFGRIRLWATRQLYQVSFLLCSFALEKRPYLRVFPRICISCQTQNFQISGWGCCQSTFLDHSLLQHTSLNLRLLLLSHFKTPFVNIFSRFTFI